MKLTMRQDEAPRGAGSTVMRQDEAPRGAGAESGSGVTMRDRQDLAIRMILLGYGEAQIVEHVGCSRATYWRWRGSAKFSEALELRRQEMYRSAADQMRALVAPAIKVLTAAMEGDDRRLAVRAAGMILRLAMPRGVREKDRENVDGADDARSAPSPGGAMPELSTESQNSEAVEPVAKTDEDLSDPLPDPVEMMPFYRPLPEMKTILHIERTPTGMPVVTRREDVPVISPGLAERMCAGQGRTRGEPPPPELKARVATKAGNESKDAGT